MSRSDVAFLQQTQPPRRKKRRDTDGDEGDLFAEGNSVRFGHGSGSGQNDPVAVSITTFFVFSSDNGSDDGDKDCTDAASDVSLAKRTVNACANKANASCRHTFDPVAQSLMPSSEMSLAVVAAVAAAVNRHPLGNELNHEGHWDAL